MQKIICCFFILFYTQLMAEKVQTIHSQKIETTTLKSKLSKTICFRIYHTMPEPFSFRLELGYILKQKNDLSIGGGMDMYFGIYDRFVGTLGVLYVKNNYYLLKRNNTPFITSAIGYGWSTAPYKDLTHKFTQGYRKEKGGMHTQIGVGYQLRSQKTAFAMSLGLYYNYQHFETYENRIQTSHQMGSTITSIIKNDVISDHHNLIIGITLGLR